MHKCRISVCVPIGCLTISSEKMVNFRRPKFRHSSALRAGHEMKRHRCRREPVNFLLMYNIIRSAFIAEVKNINGIMQIFTWILCNMRRFSSSNKLCFCCTRNKRSLSLRNSNIYSTDACNIVPLFNFISLERLTKIGQFANKQLGACKGSTAWTVGIYIRFIREELSLQFATPKFCAAAGFRWRLLDNDVEILLLLLFEITV
uniref:Uncharacterized protein n=1 Tax=Romanomermis culicivorax TaxID=13658 RepID=A0A915K553_ROMCU